jgi:hypothetical protein
VIPEIDIRRAANLMLKRYGEKALKESAARADELESRGDYDGEATWRRITVAVEQLEKKRLPGQDTDREGKGFQAMLKGTMLSTFAIIRCASHHAMATSKYVGFLISPQVRFEFSWSTSSSAAVRSYTIILHMIPSMLAIPACRTR